MNYVIDGMISFNTTRYELLHIETNEVVELVSTTGRLLDTLLSFGHGIASRDYLLEMVWDKHGLRSSNNNLNQYLSILRKLLQDLGCDDFLITVPKLGIKINDEIPIYCTLSYELTEKKMGRDHQFGALCTAKSLATLYSKLMKPRYGRNFILMSIFIIIITVISPLMINSQGYTPTLSYKMEGGCELVFLRDVSNKETKNINIQIKKIFKEHNFKCKEDRRIYFDYSTSNNTRDLGRLLISFCYLGNKGSPTLCDNVYYYNWIIK